MNIDAYAHYDALIFDMDGTLIDSGQLHEVAWTQTLTHYDIPLDRTLMRSLAGVPTLKTIAMLIENFNIKLDVSLQEVNNKKEHIVHEKMIDYVKPTALEDVVRYYHGKKPMAVGTGAYTQEAKNVLDACGLLALFDTIVGADQVDNPKPAPDTFLTCAQNINITPSKCIVFEDAKLGLEAASNAGMDSVDVADKLNIHNNYFL